MSNQVKSAELAKKTISNGGDLHSEVMTITPELAQKWLSQNTENRRISAPNIRFLKKQIVGDKWVVNGESIKFDTNGNLRDGQHRLMAIVQAGKSVQSLVTYNCPDNVMHTIDTGRNRSGSDVISMTYPQARYYNSISSIAQFVLQFNKGRFGIAKRSISSTSSAADHRIDNDDLLGFVEENGGYDGFIRFVEDVYKLHRSGDKLVQLKVFGGMKFILDSYGKKQSDKFFSDLSTGTGLVPRDPVFTLRKAMIETKFDAKNKSPYVARFRGKSLIYVIINTWNRFVNGESLGRITTLSVMPKIVKPT